MSMKRDKPWEGPGRISGGPLQWLWWQISKGCPLATYEWATKPRLYLCFPHWTRNNPSAASTVPHLTHMKTERVLSPVLRLRESHTPVAVELWFSFSLKWAFLLHGSYKSWPGGGTEMLPHITNMPIPWTRKLQLSPIGNWHFCPWTPFGSGGHTDPHLFLVLVGTGATCHTEAQFTPYPWKFGA